jgi:hypothetical protein
MLFVGGFEMKKLWMATMGALLLSAACLGEGGGAGDEPEKGDEATATASQAICRRVCGTRCRFDRFGRRVCHRECWTECR